MNFEDDGSEFFKIFSKVKEEFYCFFNPMYEEAVSDDEHEIFLKKYGFQRLNELTVFDFFDEFTLQEANGIFLKINSNPLENISHYEPIWERIFEEYNNIPPINSKDIALFFEGIEDFLHRKLKMKTLFQSSFNKIKDTIKPILLEMQPFLNQLGLYYFPE